MKHNARRSTMRCPHCLQRSDRGVWDSRPSADGWEVRRYRHCSACGRNYRTTELISEFPIIEVPA